MATTGAKPTKFVKSMVAIINAGRLGTVARQPSMQPPATPDTPAESPARARKQPALKQRLANCRFFFDLEEPVPQQVKDDLTALGGTVEQWFSKDITHLISSYAPRGSVVVSMAPGMLTPSSPAPGNSVSATSASTASLNPRVPPPASPICPTVPSTCMTPMTPTTPMTPMTPVTPVTPVTPREFAEPPPPRFADQRLSRPQAVAAQQLAARSEQSADLLRIAEQYGMTIWTLDKLRVYLQRYCGVDAEIPETPPLSAVLQSEKKRSSSLMKPLQAPYIIVEDTKDQLRPFFHEFVEKNGRSTLPQLNYDMVEGISPFYTGSDCRRSGATSSNTKRARAESAERRRNNFLSLTPHERTKAARRRGPHSGFCECCNSKFDSIDDHMFSKKHRAFANNDANYRNIDIIFEELRHRTLDRSPVILLNLPKYRSYQPLTPTSIKRKPSVPAGGSHVAKQLFEVTDCEDEVMLLDSDAEPQAESPARKRVRTVRPAQWSRLPISPLQPTGAASSAEM